MPAPSYVGLSDYEILRQKKIASNMAVMESMGLTAAVSGITSAKEHDRAEKAKKRGLASAKRKKRSAPVLPPRKSSRRRLVWRSCSRPCCRFVWVWWVWSLFVLACACVFVGVRVCARRAACAGVHAVYTCVCVCVCVCIYICMYI